MTDDILYGGENGPNKGISVYLEEKVSNRTKTY